MNNNIEIITIDPQVDGDLYLKEKRIRLDILLLPTGRTEWWGRDSISKHIQAVSNNDIVGCVLLVLGNDERNKKTAVLCQMAVLEPFRSQGIGKKLVAKCEQIGREEGMERICLHARATAVGFYEKCGYKTEGSLFEEVGLAHINMVKTITTTTLLMTNESINKE